MSKILPALLRGPRNIYRKVSGSKYLRRMSQKSRRSFPFWNNADQNYIVPALKKCVQLLIKFFIFPLTYFRIFRGPDEDVSTIRSPLPYKKDTHQNFF